MRAYPPPEPPPPATPLTDAHEPEPPAQTSTSKTGAGTMNVPELVKTWTPPGVLSCSQWEMPSPNSERTPFSPRGIGPVPPPSSSVSAALSVMETVLAVVSVRTK